MAFMSIAKLAVNLAILFAVNTGLISLGTHGTSMSLPNLVE